MTITEKAFPSKSRTRFVESFEVSDKETGINVLEDKETLYKFNFIKDKKELETSLTKKKNLKFL
jgi:hypothetical protein